MKQKFTVTGMTCVPHGMFHAVGAPLADHMRGRNGFALAPRFCLRQNAWTRLTARALARRAEQAMPQEVRI